MSKTNAKEINSLPYSFPAGYGITRFPKPYWKGRQSWDYEELAEIAHVAGSSPLIKVRIKIHSDYLDEQSWAKIEKWDGDRWQALSQIEGFLMEARPGNHGEKRPVNWGLGELTPEAYEAFMADRWTLLEDAGHILF